MLVWKKKYSSPSPSTPKSSTCVRTSNGAPKNQKIRSNTSAWCRSMRRSRRSRISSKTSQKNYPIHNTVLVCLFSQALLQTTDDLQGPGNQRAAVLIALFHAVQHGRKVQTRPHRPEEKIEGVARRKEGEQVGQIKKRSRAIYLPQQDYWTVKIRWALQLHLWGHLRIGTR